MNILLVLHQTYGGIRTHVESLATALEEMGHSCETVIDDSGESPKSQRQFRKRLQTAANRCDIVHAHGFRAAWQCSQLRGIRWCYTAHTAGLEKPKRLIDCLNSAEFGICVSNSLLQEMEAAGASNLRVNFGGVLIRETVPPKEQSRTRIGVPTDAKVVGFVGRLVPEKGLEDLLHAMQEVWYEHETAYLIIAGEGPSLGKLDEIRSGLMYRDKVRLLGKWPDAFEVYAASDLVVMPSKSEALGLSAIEAMSVGVPVVARRVGGLAEVIEDNVCGKLVDPDAFLADSIDDLLYAPTLLRVYGDAGKLRVMERFDMRVSAREITRYYSEIA